MFNWFKKTVKINDPVFGEIEFMDSYWEAKTVFPPLNKAVELFIDGERYGLNVEQYKMFTKISEKYELLTKKISPLLRKEGEFWSQKKIEDIENTFELTAISIPSKESEDMEWEFMYESILIGNPYFEVKMKYWNVTGLVEVST